MKKASKYIQLKDLILVLLLTLVVLAIALLVVPITAPLGIMWGSLTAGIIPAFLGGSIYVLMQAKAPRVDTSVLFSVPFGIYFIISGSVPTGIIFFISGLIGEAAMIGGYSKKWRPLISYVIHWLTYFYAATIQFLFMHDTVVKTYMGMDETSAIASVNA